MKKLLLYGGAFNPPHKGHEVFLKSAIEAIEPDLTIVMPTAVSPHKRLSNVRFWHRFDMCKLAFEPLGARVSGFEARGGHKKSFTIKTLKYLKKRYRGYKIFMMLGSDMLESFLSKWKEPQRILSLATLVSARRDEDDSGEFVRAARQLERMGHAPVLLDLVPIEISSSEIRTGDDRFVDEKVRSYMGRFALYGSQK